MGEGRIGGEGGIKWAGVERKRRYIRRCEKQKKKEKDVWRGRK